jgi:hypothetical protein
MTDVATLDRPTLTREYVAGGVSSLVSARMLRGLPWAFDDLTVDFGDDLYERMQLDPQVAACINVLRASIIEEGAQLSSPVEDEKADGYQQAQDVLTFCEQVLGDLVLPLDDVLWDLLSAIALGSRIAEQVYTETPGATYALPGASPVRRNKALLVLSALKPRPRHSVAFVVDAFMNVQGILGAPPGQSALSLSTVMTDSPARVPNLFDRRKFAVLTWRPRNADPRGSTVLRPAYTPWWAKMQTWPEFLKYLAQFASPSIYAVASEEATKSGVRVTNDDGTISTRPAVEVLLDTLLAYRNGTAMAVPYGTLIEALSVSGDGSAFHRAFTLCDQQISTAVLHQTLATMEGEHQARASSEVHQDTLDTIIRQAKRAVCVMLRRDVLVPLIEYNYGPKIARQFTPYVSLGSVESQDFSAYATAIASLAKSSYLDPSQYIGVDKLLNLPVREAAPVQPTQPPQDQQDQQQPPTQQEEEPV